jgi:hypothetical protein
LRPATNYGIAFSLRALHCFSGRYIVGREREGSGIFAMRSGRVALMCEEIAELDVHLECRGVVGFGGGRKVGSEESLGEFRGAVGVGKNAGSVDEGWTFAVVGRDARLQGVDHLVGLVVAFVELAEVDVGLGSFSGGDGATEFGLRDSVFFFLFGDESEQTVSLGREVRLHSGGQGLGLVEAAADEGWRGDVKLTEVVQGVNVFRIELYGALEGCADFDGEAQRA